jgi:hypothetical protein
MKHSVFNIGDIVKVTNFEYIYSRYRDAFWHFGILNKAKIVAGGYNLEPTDTALERYNKHWVVVDRARHSIDSSIIIYHIKNAYGDSLVIDSDGLKVIRKIKPNKSKDSVISTIPVPTSPLVRQLERQLEREDE